ncbi:hypothetical protein M9H77_06910 [Catharanthus roseus]|uniref:Uncharacterized protein n=1 Tax=Catharanthus roseus TaxID=4058 RepID=A0ACC0BTK4_CATRO|nr:hypothetical protein M9H77_06910 [Catharanthus roseus]
MILCSEMAHHTRKSIYQEGVLVSGSSGTTPSSSYSLREIVPEREPIPIIDLSDSETEYPSEAESDVGMLPEQEGAAPAPVDAKGMDTLAVGGSPVPLSPVSMKLLMFRNMSDSRPSNYADEAVSENSQSRQPEPTGENTPCPKRAMHTVMENFMIRMTELLETSMATRRNERVPAIGTDEALKRFLKFRPPEFYGEAEQETKAELFLEQLNDIYDTLRYEDALRWLRRGKQLLALLQPPINILYKDPGNLEILRDPVGRKRLMPSIFSPSSRLQQQQPMHRSRATYRCVLFKTVYNFCETGFGRTQSPIRGPLPMAWTIQTREKGVAQSVYVDTASYSAVGFSFLVKSQEGLDTEVGPRADLVGTPGICSLMFQPVLGERLFGNQALVWCWAGTNYEMPDMFRMTSFWDPDLVR